MRLWSRMSDCSFEELIPIFSSRCSGPPETTFGLETGNETLRNLIESFTVHGPWHGLLVSIMIGPACTKLVRLWNRLCIPCVTTWCGAGVYRPKIAQMWSQAFPLLKVEHGGTLSACIRIIICAKPCGMWNTHWRWFSKIMIRCFFGQIWTSIGGD